MTNANDLIAFVESAQRDATDRGIEARNVTAAGQNANDTFLAIDIRLSYCVSCEIIRAVRGIRKRPQEVYREKEKNRKLHLIHRENALDLPAERRLDLSSGDARSGGEQQQQ
jgi:hypothetical protein